MACLRQRTGKAWAPQRVDRQGNLVTWVLGIFGKRVHARGVSGLIHAISQKTWGSSLGAHARNWSGSKWLYHDGGLKWRVGSVR